MKVILKTRMIGKKKPISSSPKDIFKLPELFEMPYCVLVRMRSSGVTTAQQCCQL